MPRFIDEKFKDRVVARWRRDKDSGLTWGLLAKPMGISATRFREILVERNEALPSAREKARQSSLGYSEIRRAMRGTSAPYRVVRAGIVRISAARSARRAHQA